MHFKCLFGFHNWTVVEEIDGYHTDLSLDERADCGTIHHGVFKERCKCCGKHRLTATGRYHSDHPGIAKARKRWKAMEER